MAVTSVSGDTLTGGDDARRPRRPRPQHRWAVRGPPAGVAAAPHSRRSIKWEAAVWLAVTATVAPGVVDRGPGDPAVAVVGGVHGDEPSGVRAVRRLQREGLALERGVRFVLGNPPAYAADERFLDADLNRVFPGDSDAESREHRLAAQLCALTSGMPTLSLHATHATPDPIALAALDDDVAEIAARMPVPHVVDETSAVDGSFTQCSSVVTVEAGCQRTEEAIATAERQIRAFLQLTEALPGEPPEGDTAFYRVDDVVPKPGDADPTVHVDDFARVEPGTTYAAAGDEALVADEAFVPILMSGCGYDDIYGYRGTRLGDGLEEARGAMEDA